MPRFDKQAVMAKIKEVPIVPVFYSKDLSIAKAVLKACYDGGVRAFEFTNRGDFAHEIFGELVKSAGRECQEMAVGVGSVVDPGTAALYMQLGASADMKRLKSMECDGILSLFRLFEVRSGNLEKGVSQL